MNPAFTKIEPELLPILDELRRREPIFHTPEFGATTAEFERSTAPEYWEVGASGRRYSREFILAWAGRLPSHFVEAKAAGGGPRISDCAASDQRRICSLTPSIRPDGAHGARRSGSAQKLAGAFSTIRAQSSRRKRMIACRPKYYSRMRTCSAWRWKTI